MHDITIIRQRLLDEAEQDGPRILVFYGPMGYGKTSLLRNFYDRKQERAAWCRIGRECSDFSVLAEALEEAVGRACPEFSYSLEEDRGKDMEDLACDLGRAIRSLKNPPRDIILDDFQEMQEEEAGRFLGILFLALPKSVRLLIGTRDRIPGFALRYLADGTSRVFCSQMLSFTKEEVEEAVKRAGIPRLEETAAAVWNRTMGWPAGVMLILFSLKNNGLSGGEEAVEKLCTSPVMRRLLKQEILGRQPDYMRRFMALISPLQKPEKDLCLCAFGIEDAPEKLLWLFQRGLLYQWRRGSGQYEWNPLFREYIESLLPAGERARILGEAARWFLEQRRIKEAADCAVKAGGREILVRILREQGYALLADGKVELLEQCLEFLLQGDRDDKEQEQEAFLLLFEGLVHRKRGREQAELRAFETAMQKAAAARQLEIYAKALFCTARCLAERGEQKQAEIDMRDGIRENLKPYTAVWYEGMLGWAYIRLYAGREKEALETVGHMLRPVEAEGAEHMPRPEETGEADRCQDLRLQAEELAEILKARSSLHLWEILERIDKEASQRRMAGSLCAAKLILTGSVPGEEIEGLLGRLDVEVQTALHARARIECGYVLFEQGRWEEGSRQICAGVEMLNRMHLSIWEGKSQKNLRIYQIYAAVRRKSRAVGSGVHLAACCFGEFDVYVLETEEKIHWRTRKARDCMAFLLHQGSRGASRSELMGALWDEGGPDNEVAAFHNILSSLRKSFSAFGEDLIVCRDKKYFVEPGLIYTDIGMAEEIVEAVRRGEAEKLLAWEGILTALAGGGYFRNIDQPWADQARYYYDRHIYEGLVMVGNCHVEREEFLAAESSFRLAVNLDTYGLAAIAGLLDCYQKMGERIRMRRFYDEIRKKLGPELSKELEALRPPDCI